MDLPPELRYKKQYVLPGGFIPGPKKPKDVDDEALDAELGVNHSIAHMDARLVADHVAQRTARFKPELSIEEREDWHIPGELRRRLIRSTTRV